MDSDTKLADERTAVYDFVWPASELLFEVNHLRRSECLEKLELPSYKFYKIISER